jgi:branched-chain amino acid transport system substrate-binding protein
MRWRPNYQSEAQIYTKYVLKNLPQAKIGWKPTHFLTEVSNSTPAVLQPAGLEASKGLISSFYLKDPDDPKWQEDSAVKQWRAWMIQYHPEGSLHSVNNVEAYAAAQALVHILEKCGDNLTRENITKEAANIKDLELPMLLPGIKVNTGPTDFYPIQQLQLARFDGQKWVLFGEVLEAAVKQSGAWRIRASSFRKNFG